MKLIKLTFTLLSFLTIGLLNAQDLPQASPKGKIEQTIGLTNFKIEYSRPSVRDRKIFGELLPFDKVWRLGANAPTMITIDQPITIDNQVLPEGTYAIFAFPGEKEWKIVFNSDVEQWGANNYDESKDLVTIKVKILDEGFTETLTIEFGNFTINSADLIIKWEKITVKVPFTLATADQAEKNIKIAIEKGEKLDQVYYNASRYYSINNNNTEANKYIELSIKEKSGYKNLFQKAKYLAAEGKKSEAIKLAEKALIDAKESKADSWIGYIQESIDEWSKN